MQRKEKTLMPSYSPLSRKSPRRVALSHGWERCGVSRVTLVAVARSKWVSSDVHRGNGVRMRLVLEDDVQRVDDAGNVTQDRKENLRQLSIRDDG